MKYRFPLLLIAFFSFTIAGPPEIPLRIGYSKSLFRGLNTNDISAALNLWLDEFQQELREKTGKNYKVVSFFFDDCQPYLKGKKTGFIDVINVEALDYIRFADSSHWSLRKFDDGEGIHPEPWLLLVKKDGPIKKLEDLQGQKILMPEGQQQEVIRLWLNILTLKSKGQEAEDFFSKIESVKSPSKGTLDVFFGNSLACLTPFNTFQTICELNPQIKQQLKTLVQSPPLETSVTAINKKLSPELRDMLTEIIMNLHKSERGRQILTLFGAHSSLELVTDRPLFEGEYQLLEQYHRLKKQSGK